MNYWIYNCILIIIIIVFAYNNSFVAIPTESFTPNIREMYRPAIRNLRLGANGFYNKHSSNLHNLFRKNGII